MGVRRLLVIGNAERLRKVIVSTLRSFSGVSVSEAELSQGSILQTISTRYADLVLVECADFTREVIAAVRVARPGTPIIGYAHGIEYAAVRDAFKAGLKDVLDLKTVRPDEIRESLEWALDPGSADSAGARLHIIQFAEEAKKRGVYLEERMRAGSPPPFYMNGNRAEILRADVLSQEQGSDWRLEASKIWVTEFGARSSMIFPDRGAPLRLGALIEQDFTNRAYFKKMLDSKLESCFERLRAIGCICAATYYSADYLSASLARQLDSLTDLVFYLEDCQLLLDGTPRRNTILPDRIYNEFCTAVAVRNEADAVRLIDSAVAKLRSDMPAIAFAREKMNRFLWDLIAIIRGDSDASEAPLNLDNSSLTALRNSIVAVVQATMEPINDGAAEKTPLDALIHRIKTNPGLAINIDQAAEQIGFSRSHFCRVFRSKTGQSFSAFLTKCRVELACDLLEKTGMQPDEVSSIVGIPNTWYFKKVFSEQTGMTVDDWILNRRKSRSPI